MYCWWNTLRFFTLLSVVVAMDKSEIFAEIVKSRRSVRGFLPKQASEQTLKAIFEEASFAPSNCNTQPWHVHVVSGEPLEVLRKKLPEALAKGEYDMDFPYSGTYEGVYKERQYDAAKQLFGAMGIAREDKAGRAESFMRNFTFFDAPHVAFLFLPEAFGMREACDLGMYAQTLMLAIKAHGLDSCPQTALSFNASLIRSELGVSTNLKLMLGLSFGYEDVSVSANNARVGRASLEMHTTFHG